ncbi:hypothetical protein [Paenibacillus sp. N3.4]|uniref:hypothetical protein n=1 Tax=Paenibacillus sp. N3.4 TaxID=2603222 RepID=UPI0037C9A485
MRQVFQTADGCAKQQDVKLSKTKDKEGREWFNRYGEGLAALTSGIFIAIAWGIGSSSQLWSIVFYLIAFGVGGFVKAKEGLHTLIAERDLDVNLLMLIAAAGAAVSVTGQKVRYLSLFSRSAELWKPTPWIGAAETFLR